MIKRIPILMTLVGILVVFGQGCVEVPDSGITPPDYNAQVRVIYADPLLPTATLSVADNAGDGKTFRAFVDMPAGAFGSASGYMTYKAGVKRINVKKADGTLADTVTATITFATDAVSALLVMPRRDPAESRIVQIGERSTFAGPGRADTALVRFVNALASKDTVDVWRIAGSSPAALGNDNLRYSITSAFSRVPRDSTWRFYVTRYTGSTAGRGDTVTVVGASNKQYTVVLCDSLARIKVLKFEDK